MDVLESSVQTACETGKIPGAVLVAADRKGTFQYAKAFGYRSLEGDKPPCELDTVFRLFSATKLFTTIAVLQLVEQGKISLDDDTASVLPELAALPILTGMKDGKGELKERRNPITLRHLLTHSSGLAYTFMSPTLQAYQESIGKGGFSPPKTIVESFSTPLVFEPGTSWIYSPSIDWAGLLVARISKTSLEDYVQKNIFARLDITDITYWPEKNAQLASRLVTMSIRDKPAPEGSGKAVPFKGPGMTSSAQEEFGGQGLSATMPSYLKVLQSLLLDDEKLLSKETTAKMFQPQLTPQSAAALQAVYDSQPKGGPCAIGHFPPNVQYDWGLGGLLTMQDVDWRKKGALAWSGMPNLLWFVDREAGLCGVFGCQLMPSGDAQAKEITTLFEKTVYAQVVQKSAI